MLRSLGADAIGMSTIVEVIQARALGLDDVLETGKNAAVVFAGLLQAEL